MEGGLSYAIVLKSATAGRGELLIIIGTMLKIGL
jgi:hypothetical protein